MWVERPQAKEGEDNFDPFLLNPGRERCGRVGRDGATHPILLAENEGTK